MGQIRNMLNARAGSEEQSFQQRRARLRSEMKVKLPQLGKAAIETLQEANFMHQGSAGEFTEIEYANDRQAAWDLRIWPTYDLPSSVEAYRVALLESGTIVSVRRSHGIDRIEAYDPDRYDDSFEELGTVYATLAKLPKNYFFETEWMRFLRE